MAPVITGWATLVCGLLFFALTFRVIAARRASGVSLGDGGDKLVMRRMRGQANAAEQMPLTLIALLIAELIGGSTVVLGLLAFVFCMGRLLHGIGFGWLEHSPPLRMAGMATSALGTIATLLYLAFVLITQGSGG